MKNLVVGFNHRFGHDKEGDYRLLNGLHDEFGFRVTEIEKQDVDAEKVSSTVIRRLIERGEMNKAARDAVASVSVGRRCGLRRTYRLGRGSQAASASG